MECNETVLLFENNRNKTRINTYAKHTHNFFKIRSQGIETERQNARERESTKQKQKTRNETEQTNERMWMKHREMNNDEIALWIL